jgi:hypothetical protein
LPSLVPAARAASRFRLPIEPPTRQLLIASLAAIAGACQLFAWALARLPWFFLVLGLFLIGIALAIALAALVRHHRLRWVAYVGPAALTVARGNRRKAFSWTEVAAVRYADFRLRVMGSDGRPLCTLPVDRTRAADAGAGQLRQAIQAQLDGSDDR